MTIPPHRAPGDIGHIGDHNDIADVLTGQQADIASNSNSIISHTTGDDPHGDRAYANETFSPIDHTHDQAVQSVNGQTGAVVLTAGSLGAETPAGAQAKVDALADTVIPLSQKGAISGVAELDSGGKVPLAQLPDLSASYVTTGADNNPQVTNAASTRGFARVDLNYTATGTTPDTFAFYYGGATGSGGTRTGYHNEYGELRARPALQNTVALRAMGHTAGSTGNIFEVAHAALTPVYLAVSQTAAVFSVPVTATDLTATGDVTAANLPPSIGSGTVLPDPSGFSDGAIFFLHA